MNADAYFETGSGKALCQDYAIAGSIKGTAYAIGADGCSSSADTDVGARLLSLTARSVCVSSWEYLRMPNIMTAVKSVEHLIVDRCKGLWRNLNVPPACFDATLWIILWPDDGDVVIFGWGDGAVIADYGTYTHITTHQYPYNAPLYLSYGILPTRKELHKAEHGHKLSFVNEWIVNDKRLEDKGAEKKSFTLDWDQSFYRVLSKEGLESIAVCSDGINTYMDEKNEPIEFWKMALEFTAYKNKTGEFVKRRMRKIAKENKILGFHHYDDIFCATIAGN